ncbi:PhzF family phenazine biosynthesis protein [Candidatus Symbiopectobacterium endolongispinus]|nr:PhzF family phenazine biosynthesis protein [Candidatus Symbiopectobacterium sp. PLON1]MBT9428458.1 PhzF family phenazine biosynthesis protein [Candidatus Symbiopectobacterium endolongispinus]
MTKFFVRPFFTYCKRITITIQSFPYSPHVVPQLSRKLCTVYLTPNQVEVRAARDYLVVLENQQQVEALTPDIHAMKPLGKLVCVTAPGDDYDFVSRFFCPGEAVVGDPVTSSAHSMLIPYWHDRLGKNTMRARQVSPRGGDLHCQWQGDRVLISGQAVTYLEGKIFLR